MATEELTVITKAYDLAKEMTQRTRKLPRDLEFVLGDRMLSTSYDILDTLVEAKYSRAKRPDGGEHGRVQVGSWSGHHRRPGRIQKRGREAGSVSDANVTRPHFAQVVHHG